MPKGIPRSGVRMTKARKAEMANIDNMPSRFSVNQRFDFLKDLVQMVGKFQTPSLICSGAGGLGKSHTINKTLQDMGYVDVSLIDDDLSEYKNTYRTVKGSITPMGLYRTLYENRNNILIMDDCDKIFSDPTSVNLLKGSLDSTSKRVISWKSERMDDSLPSVFEYTGGVIIVTNISSQNLDEPVRTRSMVVDLAMNNRERVERMENLIEQDDFMSEYEYNHKVDALNLIKFFEYELKELSLRTLIKTVKIRASNKNNWTQLAEYMLVG